MTGGMFAEGNGAVFKDNNVVGCSLPGISEAPGNGQPATRLADFWGGGWAWCLSQKKSGSVRSSPVECFLPTALPEGGFFKAERVKI